MSTSRLKQKRPENTPYKLFYGNGGKFREKFVGSFCKNSLKSL